MIGIPKLIGYDLAVIFFTLMLTTSLLAPQLHSANAGGNSAYEAGRDHGCDDARLSPSDRYINEPGKGPNNHTPEFMSGYRDGFQNCGSGGGDDDSDSSRDNGGSSGNRENLGSRLCNLVDSNRGAATIIARLLGYPGLDQAALDLCGAMAD
jgi:hypothetical protein